MANFSNFMSDMRGGKPGGFSGFNTFAERRAQNAAERRENRVDDDKFNEDGSPRGINPERANRPDRSMQSMSYKSPSSSEKGNMQRPLDADTLARNAQMMQMMQGGQAAHARAMEQSTAQRVAAGLPLTGAQLKYQQETNSQGAGGVPWTPDVGKPMGGGMPPQAPGQIGNFGPGSYPAPGGQMPSQLQNDLQQMQAMAQQQQVRQNSQSYDAQRQATLQGIPAFQQMQALQQSLGGAQPNQQQIQQLQGYDQQIQQNPQLQKMTANFNSQFSDMNGGQTPPSGGQIGIQGGSDQYGNLNAGGVPWTPDVGKPMGGQPQFGTGQAFQQAGQSQYGLQQAGQAFQQAQGGMPAYLQQSMAKTPPNPSGGMQQGGMGQYGMQPAGMGDGFGLPIMGGGMQQTPFAGGMQGLGSALPYMAQQFGKQPQFGGVPTPPSQYDKQPQFGQFSDVDPMQQARQQAGMPQQVGALNALQALPNQAAMGGQPAQPAQPPAGGLGQVAAMSSPTAPVKGAALPAQ